MAADSGALRHTAWLLCGDPHRAEELTQQALVSTYLAWPRAKASDPLAYARRTLANARIDAWRRRRNEVLAAPGTLPERSAPGHDDRVVERDRLVRALQSLPARQRRVVVLRHFVGLSEAEVAEELGVTLGTVKSGASRGLAKLRKHLGDEARTPDPTGGAR
jgi:RNA polymerase sigma-70 factor (sigma-E family)